MGHGAQAIQTQTDFRGRADTVDESNDAGWFAPVNTNWVIPITDTDDKFRVRFALEASSIVDISAPTYNLAYSYNNGSFIPVTPTSSIIKSVTSDFPGYNDDDKATQLITNHLNYDPSDNNALINAGDDETGVWTIDETNDDPQACESEWVLQLLAEELNIGDIIELRLRTNNGSPIGGGYDHSPVITIKGPPIEIKSGEIRINSGNIRIQ